MTGTTTAILLPQLDGRFNSEKVLTLVFTLFCSARVFWSIMDKIYLPFKFNILLNLMQFLKLFFVFHLGMLKHTHVYFTSMEMFVHFCTPSRFLKYHRKFLTRDATISIRFPSCCQLTNIHFQRSTINSQNFCFRPLDSGCINY